MMGMKILLSLLKLRIKNKRF